MLAFYHHEFYKKQTNTHKQKQVSIPTFAFCPTCPLFSWFLWAVATQWQRCVLNMSVCLSAVAASLQWNVGMNHTASHPPYPLLPCATSSSSAAHKGVKNWADKVRGLRGWEPMTPSVVKLQGANTEQFGPKSSSQVCLLGKDPSQPLLLQNTTEVL